MAAFLGVLANSVGSREPAAPTISSAIAHSPRHGTSAPLAAAFVVDPRGLTWSTTRGGISAGRHRYAWRPVYRSLLGGVRRTLAAGNARRHLDHESRAFRGPPKRGD